MPDFHDPQTREMMEREGWTWDAGISPDFAPAPYFYQYICSGRTKLAVWECGFFETAYTHHSPDGERAWIDIVPYQLKSFAAALNAANAILEGVEG